MGFQWESLSGRSNCIPIRSNKIPIGDRDLNVHRTPATCSKKNQIPKTYMLEIRDAMPFSLVFVSFESGRELQGFGILWHSAPFFCGAGCPKRKHRGGYLGLSRGTKVVHPSCKGGGTSKKSQHYCSPTVGQRSVCVYKWKRWDFWGGKGACLGHRRASPWGLRWS